MVFGGTSNTVSNSQAVGNGNNGMVFNDGGNQITENQANNNKAGDGMVIGKSGNSLTGNVANGNGSIGSLSFAQAICTTTPQQATPAAAL